MKTRIIAAVLALLLPAGACSDIGTDPYLRHAGPYILHSIDGQELPVALAETEEGTFTVTTGALTLRRDRTFTEVWTGRLDPPEGEPVHGAISASGTYELNGEEVTFRLPAAPGRDEATVIGALRGDTLMYVAAGRLIVYLD